MTEPGPCIGPLPEDDVSIDELQQRLAIDELLIRVDTELARRLLESIAQNARLRTRLAAARHALEMVRDANRDDPHIPAIALATIEQAIQLADDLS